MSKLTKTIDFNGKTVTVYELTVAQIKSLWKELTAVPVKNPTENDIPLFQNHEFLTRNWALCVSGISLEETDNLTPSELKLIYDAFMECNAIFFDLALQVEGENPLLHGFRMAIQADLIARFAFSSAAGM